MKEAKRYNGKPCVRCEGTERYVKNHECVVCHKRRNADYAQSRPDRVSLSSRRASVRRSLRELPTSVLREIRTLRNVKPAVLVAHDFGIEPWRVHAIQQGQEGLV